MTLTAISLVPPLLSKANPATTTALLALHLVPATVMMPHPDGEPPHPDRLTMALRRVLGAESAAVDQLA